ncbi:replication initiator protein [Microviridae sp.]|nr:replication initiator protein [Microviridae sp.]
MTCYHPLEASIQGTKYDGTKILKFGQPESPAHQTLQLPCGQCIGCRIDYANMWAIRAMHENQMHEQSCFITLTYDPEFLPYGGTLVPKHLQDFLKRLRKKTPKIRFYACGEYGETVGKRPHYHALIFGWEPGDKELFYEIEGIQTFTSETLEKIWGKGFCTLGNVDLDSCAYVARYCTKKIKPSDQSPEQFHERYTVTCYVTGEVIDLEPEFARMSNRPGIAKDWFTQYHPDIFPYDTCIWKGKNVRTPRYYENLLRSSDQLAYDRLKDKRYQGALKAKWNNTPSRLRVRKTIQEAKLSMKQRKLDQ